MMDFSSVATDVRSGNTVRVRELPTEKISPTLSWAGQQMFLAGTRGTSEYMWNCGLRRVEIFKPTPL